MDATRRWAASGAMALTGDPGCAPLVAPSGVVERIESLAKPFAVDALALLGERAAIAGLRRRGRVSCGGATRLLPAADGWVAVCLARDDDVDLIPAWLEVEPPTGDPWPTVEAAVGGRARAEIVDRASLLGLPVAAVGEVPAGAPVVRHRIGEAPALTDRPRIVDLSSLWAGPLCTHLTSLGGADVIKVESTSRPDGARRGPAAFFDLLHAGQRFVALDFATPAGRASLLELVRGADVVVEGSRPRALAQLGVDAESIVGEGPRVWVSITGYGRSGSGAGRVAFGDDAAAAGGLVAWGEDGVPRFVADAVADPLAGMAAAAAVVAALDAGGRWLLDVSMARVAAHIAGPADRTPWVAGDPAEAAPPRARR